MEKAIQKAIEGGYQNEETTEYGYVNNKWQIVTSDILFWQALGKALGWSDSDVTSVWKYYWHEFISHLSEEKNIDAFFNELIK